MSPKVLNVLTNPVRSDNNKQNDNIQLRPPFQQVPMYPSNPFNNDFDDAMLKKGSFFLNRDRSDSINVFKQKSPGLINDGFDSPNISPVL